MTKASWELLLAVEHDEGVAAAYRDREDGFHWLSGAEDGGSRIERRRFTFEGLQAAWVYAGFPPAGAVRVMARDAHGAWSEGAAGNGCGSRP